jgi:hypothetical protein
VNGRRTPDIVHAGKVTADLEGRRQLSPIPSVPTTCRAWGTGP